MNDWQWLSAEAIHWAWPVLGVMIWYGWRMIEERRQVATHLSGLMSKTQVNRRSIQQWTSAILMGLGMLSAVIALMEPVIFGQESVKEQSIDADVVVLLDLSKSMLAEDAPPNRLDRAKYEIMEMVDAMPDYRFALVGFAGSASVLCPLTKDVGFFQMILNNTTTESIGRGGTQIGTALKKGLDAFAGGTTPKLLVLITDGEDHNSDPLASIEGVVKLGIPVVTIGFGSEEGSPITLTDPETGAKTELKDRDDTVVISRLDGELLREIALQTDGAFIPAGVASLDLEGIVQSHITPIVNASSIRQVTTKVHIHGRWIGLALVLVTLAQLVSSSSIGWGINYNRSEGAV